jgi:putative tricarboxylic transport membrane protein
VNRSAARKAPEISALVVAVILFALAAVIAFDASRLEISSTYGLGPKAVPMAIAVGIGLLGIGHLVMAFRGAWPEPEPGDPKAILLILGGLAALIALIGLGGGFIPATTVSFVATATAFGRRSLLTDLAIGFGLALVVFLIFDKLLTLSLPAGPIERLLS